MIRHTKSGAVPSSLARGVPANAANCAAYSADPAAYRSGAAKFDIKKSIYGTNVVKKRLKADQNDKCAFCEAVFDANVAGDVEHYRPKGAIETDIGNIYPGYYWLGYSWPNLSYACPDCNEYRKRHRFPLEVEAARARDHTQNIANEQPFLLDPYGLDDPRDHIRFRGEAPIGITPRGERTIELLALDRVPLSRDRIDHLETLSLLHESVRILSALNPPTPEIVSHLASLQAKLAQAILPAAKFSSAAADHLAALNAGQNFLPIS